MKVLSKAVTLCCAALLPLAALAQGMPGETDSWTAAAGGASALAGPGSFSHAVLLGDEALFDWQPQPQDQGIYDLPRASAVSGGLSVEVVPAPTAAIAEPSTYALLLAGLSAMGFLARRRRRG